MKPILTIVILYLFPISLFGQFNETIRSGRPGQAIGAYTVGSKVIQIQSGISLNNIEDAVGETKSLAQNTVLRIGISEIFEVSGLINWQSDKISTNGINRRRKGISNAQLGARINILERKNAIPAIGLQGRILLKAQGSDFEREKLGSKIVLATGSKITDWLILGTNWGVTWSGNNDDPKSLYILNFSFPISEAIGGFVEVYGSFNDFKVNYDTGFSILIEDDFQLDLSGGWQGQRGITDWFLDAGISWRFDWRDETKQHNK